MSKSIQTSRPHLIVDDREIRSGILEHLQSLEHFNISVSRMPVADYCIDGNLWIERKTITDLLASIRDGRFFQQSYRLQQCMGHQAIILEGTNADLKNSHFSWNAVQGALITVSVFWEIPLLRSHNLKKTADLLVLLAKQNRRLNLTNPYKSFIYPRQPNTQASKHQSQLALLCSFPGLGRKKAQRLLQHFGSIEKVLMAEKEELQQVAGIGNTIATQIQHIIKEEQGSYSFDSL